MGDPADWFARKLAERGAAPLSPSSPPVSGFQSYPHAQAPAVRQPNVPYEQTPVYDEQGRINWRSWRGGVATRVEKQTCPGCGSNNYFQNRNHSGRGNQPSPHCFDCGYPTVQFGSELGEGSTMSPNGG